jgi:hypothetical protein
VTPYPGNCYFFIILFSNLTFLHGGNLFFVLYREVFFLSLESRLCETCIPSSDDNLTFWMFRNVAAQEENHRQRHHGKGNKLGDFKYVLRLGAKKSP